MEKGTDHPAVRSSAPEIEGAVSVSDFDYSADNFFAAIGEISTLCGASDAEESFEATEVERFSSMITFMKEWRQYYYKPTTVNFAYETKSTEVKDVMEGINLSQFSSAVVPKMEQVRDKTRLMDSNDFVLHAGGPVWALDWCPRIAEKFDYNIKCEYLAVAAHPPGCTYNKIGLPLIGRGIIQIWCLLSIDEKTEFMPPRPKGKGRPRKNPVSEEPLDGLRPRSRPQKRPAEKEPLYERNDEEGAYLSRASGGPLKKPRGRPRKIPILGLNGVKGSSIPTPRGRPRKRVLPSVTNLSDKEESPPHSSCPIQIVNENIPPLSVDLGEVALALPAAADLNDKEESSPSMARERPRKKPIPSVKDKSSVPKHRGRPRKKSISSGNECAPASAIELGEDASALPSSRGLENTSLNGLSIGLKEVTVALPAFAELSGKVGSFAPKRRGRPRKKPIPSGDDCAPASAVELGEDTSAPSTSRGLENSSLNRVSVDLQEVAVALPAFADSNGKAGSSVPRRRERKKQIPNVNECIPTSGVEVGEDAHTLLNSSTKGLSVGLDEVTFALPASTDINGKKGSSMPRSKGSKTRVQRIKDKARAAAGKNSRHPILSTTSGDKGLPVTVQPTHDNHCQDVMILSELVGQNRPRKAGTTSSIIPEGIALPRIVLCLAHNGKVAWDVKWRPSDVNDSEGKCHMGYLAVLLGDGSLEVWEVPFPKMVKILYTSCRSEGTDPRFLKLKPVFRCSKVKCGDRQSIPLTVEWSPSASRDLILAGCHDGTVAMWKFSTHHSSLDTKPLLCFTADSVPIRALAWSPDESDAESANLIVTAGHEGLKFWDIRDPYRPLWDFNPVQRVILSLDWLKNPRCIIVSFDDGTLRTISLWNASYDVPVTGKPFVGTKQLGMHNYQCSPFAIWSIHVSRTTGLAAYCGADGSAIRFQLTAKSVDKDVKGRYREPHFLCGSLAEEGQTLKINTPLPNSPLEDIPLSTKKPPYDCRNAPHTLRSYLSDANQVLRPNSQFPALCSGDDQPVGYIQTPMKQTPPKLVGSKKRSKTNPSPISGLAKLSAVQGALQSDENQDGESGRKIEVLPPKIVAMHQVRWNMNKGCERWLCYGGAAGIVRCQKIPLPTPP